MPSKKLTRTTYRDPTDPSTPLRSGDVARAEGAMDMDEYYRPLEQVHASGLHRFGAAEGLRVNATNGAPGIRVLPGIALDGVGRHISLAAGGQAEVGVQPDSGAAPQLVLVDAVNGALVPTAGQSGDRLVVIRHWETFDASAWNMFNAYVFMHTPWIRLVGATGYIDNGNEVILARVTIDGAGNVTSLTQGPRHGVGLPTETIELRRAHQAAPAPGFGVADTAYGAIRPRPNGGVQITASGATDGIELSRDNGGSVATVALAGEKTEFRRNDGISSVRVDAALGNIEVGEKGVEGTVLIYDANRRLTITHDGHDALGVYGAEGIDGEVRVKSRNGQNSVQARGDGDIWFRGRLRDYGNSHPGITHFQLKELTDGGDTTLHRHPVINGSSGTRVGVKSGRVSLLDPNSNMTGSVSINFQTNVATPSGVGFVSHSLSGSPGNFLVGTAHILVTPSIISLSTNDDVWFEIHGFVSSSEVTIMWQIDTAGKWSRQSLRFLIVGAMA